MIKYPSIDPVIFSAGPVAVRWYGLMYVIGFAVAWWLGRKRASSPASTWTAIDVDDLIFYSAIGVIVGGRLGWITAYGFEQVVSDPLMVFRVWKGGMSFHGGLVGVLIALAVFAKRRQRRFADVMDFLAPLPGIGLCAGRIGNFINGELWGKPTDAPWGFVVDPSTLYPSQAQEAEDLCRRCILHSSMSRRWRAYSSLRSSGSSPQSRGRDWLHPASFSLGTVCFVSWWSSCVCRTRIAAICYSVG